MNAPILSRRASVSRRVCELALVFGLALGAFAACGTNEPPSASLPVPPTHVGPTACIVISLADCDLAVQAALKDSLWPDGQVSLIEVWPDRCAAGACPEPLAVGDQLGVVVELVGADPRYAIVRRIADGFLVVDKGETTRESLKSRSGRVAGPGPHPFTLGHCGATSPIDFDGSLWDPVGTVDEPNAVDGTITLTSPNTAVFLAPQVRIDLVRHAGARGYSGCA